MSTSVRFVTSLSRFLKCLCHFALLLRLIFRFLQCPYHFVSLLRFSVLLNVNTSSSHYVIFFRSHKYPHHFNSLRRLFFPFSQVSTSIRFVTSRYNVSGPPFKPPGRAWRLLPKHVVSSCSRTTFLKPTLLLFRLGLARVHFSFTGGDDYYAWRLLGVVCD